MKKPKVEKINLPYASTVASFYGDQNAVQGNSFLGRMFGNRSRTVVSQTFNGSGGKAASVGKSGNLFNAG